MKTQPNKEEGPRLNKYLANAGIASRRKADELIAEGKVTVNGKVITEMGYRLNKNDQVTFDGKPVKLGEKMIYILLNKPGNLITTTSDEKGRKTVMDLVRVPGDIRIYPVGRLDRKTTGLLLLTNDGDLAQKLSHPSYNIEKLYSVELNKPLTRADLDKIRQGLVLEDGPVAIDQIAYSDPHNKNMVGVAIHLGKNRIVRRIFEHLGYEVEKLDRVIYAGLTKKNLPRGKWRNLSPKEVIQLKHLK